MKNVTIVVLEAQAFINGVIRVEFVAIELTEAVAMGEIWSGT